MYQPYPGGAQTPEPPGIPQPPAIAMAARLMYAGAAASLAGIVLDVATAGSMRGRIAKLSPKLTPAQVNSLYHVQIVFLIISGLIAVGAWIWLASACKSGKGWARVVATVLFAINTVGVLAGFVAGAVPGTGAGRFFGVIIWLIGLAVIVLLWQRDSSGYFRAQRQR